MENQTFIYISLALNVLCLVGLIVLFVFYKGLKDHFHLFFRGGDRNFQEMVERQINDIQLHKDQIKAINVEIAALQANAKICFQKMAFVRFNPFQDVGSDQSFCLCLLDDNNDGFVITSHFGRDFNKIYSKSIKGGQSEYSLSDEEKKVVVNAVNKAVKNKI